MPTSGDIRASRAHAPAVQPEHTDFWPTTHLPEDSLLLAESNPRIVQEQAIARLRHGGAPTPRLVEHAFSTVGPSLPGGTFMSLAQGEMTRQLGALLEEMPQPSPDRESVSWLLAQVERCLVWCRDMEVRGASAVQKVSRDICANIKSQPRVLVACPLLGTDGAHAVLLETMQQVDGRYTVRIYNTGCFNAFHYRDPRGGTKKQNYFEVNHVAADVIENPRTLRRLLELGYGARVIKHTLGQNALALYVWAASHGTMAPPAGVYHAEQTTKTCAWKCLTSYIKEYLRRPLFLRLKTSYQSRILSEFAATQVPFLAPLCDVHTLFAPGYAVHQALGQPMVIPVWTACATVAVQVGCTWSLMPEDMALLVAARQKLAKTQLRFYKAALRVKPHGAV